MLFRFAVLALVSLAASSSVDAYPMRLNPHHKTHVSVHVSVEAPHHSHHHGMPPMPMPLPEPFPVDEVTPEPLPVDVEPLVSHARPILTMDSNPTDNSAAPTPNPAQPEWLSGLEKLYNILVPIATGTDAEAALKDLGPAVHTVMQTIMDVKPFIKSFTPVRKPDGSIDIIPTIKNFVTAVKPMVEDTKTIWTEGKELLHDLKPLGEDAKKVFHWLNDRVKTILHHHGFLYNLFHHKKAAST